MNRLTVETAQQIVDAMYDVCDVEAEVYEDYSGRGMYGEKVVGITSQAHDAEIAMGYAAGWLGDEIIDWSDLPTRTDSMGRGVILY